MVRENLIYATWLKIQISIKENKQYKIQGGKSPIKNMIAFFEFIICINLVKSITKNITSFLKNTVFLHKI